jgi:hypothetical protein
MGKFKLIPTMLVAAALVACGGGGTSTTPNLTISGTAATGAALAGATIVVVDAKGNSEECSAKTTDTGTYSCPLYKAKTAPFVMQAALGKTKVHAVVPDASSQTINITPISELMAQKYASSAGVSASEIVARPDQATNITNATTKATSAVEVVTAVVAEVLKTAGTGTTMADPLSGNLQAGNTSDKLDQMLSTMKFAASAAEFKIYIPAADGVVTVTVAYGTTKETAKTDTATAVASKTVDLSQGQTFEAAVKNVIAKINSGTATEIESVVGFQYDQGRTPAQWAKLIIDEWRAGFGTLTVKGIEKIAIDPITKTWLTKAVLESSLGGSTEILLGMKDVSTTSTPNWKMMGDELRVHMGIELRHELRMHSSLWDVDPSKPTFEFGRKFNTWVDTSEYDASTAPAVLEVHVLKLEESYSNTRTPDFYLHKPTGSTASCNKYTVSKTSCDDIFVDEGTALYERMASNQTKFIIKATDSVNGACVNCLTDGTPKTVIPAQRAYSVKTMFGPAAVEATLKKGVKDLGSDTEKYIRTYFAAPSSAEISKLYDYIYSASPAADLSLSWLRPTISSNTQIDGLWGWISPCNGTGQDLSSQTDEIWAKKENSFVVKNIGTDLKDKSYISIDFQSKSNDAVFKFTLSGDKSKKVCS